MHGWCWRKKSCGNFWKHRKSILNLFSKLNIICIHCMKKTTQSTIIHDRSLIKYSHKKSKAENWISNKNGQLMSICQYKTEEPKNIEKSTPISLGFVLLWNKHVSPKSKMTVFHTYNKKYRIKNVVIWVEIRQLHRYTIVVMTWFYLKTRMIIYKA